MNRVKNWFQKITTNKNIGQLVFRSFMMVLVPYLYLFVCGFIDNSLLKSGFAHREGYILFVFASLMLFWLIGFILIGISIYKYVRRDTAKVVEAAVPAKPQQTKKKAADKDDIIVEEIV